MAKFYDLISDDTVDAMSAHNIQAVSSVSGGGWDSSVFIDSQADSQIQIAVLERRVDQLQVQQMAFEQLIRFQGPLFIPANESWETKPGDRVTIWLD